MYAGHAGNYGDIIVNFPFTFFNDSYPSFTETGRKPLPRRRTFTSQTITNQFLIILKITIMNIRKSLLAAALLMSVSAITFAQEPAKPAKKEKAKSEKPVSDTAKVKKPHHSAPKKAA